MCGIAVLVDWDLRGDRARLLAVGEEMANALRHRGPDGSGVWCDEEHAIALSHRRLAIIDPTPAGSQPMVSANGRWVISYNGEIYNAEPLASQLRTLGVSFRSTCDTEVILEAVSLYGLSATLSQLNGMFAIILWDRLERTLHLIRDRIGIKPLYYGIDEGCLWAASELKSIHVTKRFRLEIDEASVGSFLRFGYVPAPWSIFKGVAKVMPGEVVSLGPDGGVTRNSYWSLVEVARTGRLAPFEGSDAEAEAALHDLLADAVSGQMVSDVPLGALLSGGVDSSTIVALMVQARRGPVRTYSIGFPETRFDESKHAAAVARHLGTDHTELTLSGSDALTIIPTLADTYDEPFADSSQIPTFLVSRLARAHVTVALSGDGGDELFAGYHRYRRAEKLDARLSRMSDKTRRRLAATFERIPDCAANIASVLFPHRMVPARVAEKLRLISEILPCDRDALYLRLVSLCPKPNTFTRGIWEHPIAFDRHATANASYTARMQLLDTLTYLPDDILQKVDRASMAVSLEVRPPLLDHRVAEFAARLPPRFHFRDGQSKWLLRRIAYRYVPQEMLDRPKMGFVVPLAEWLRGPLREWAEDLFDPARFGGGILDSIPVRQLWNAHLDRRRDVPHALWALLMFEAWRRRWAESAVVQSR